MFGNTMTQDDLNRLNNANVLDETGEKVGTVGQIYLDDQTNRPTWVTVKTGLFGTKETFVPLDRATQDGDDIRVPYTKAFIKDAPNMDADHHISAQEEDELYRYYGLSAAGYAETDANRTAGVADVDRDRVADRDAVADRDRVADRDQDGSVVRREEELRVGTERVEAGRVRLRKHVVTEQQTVNVPVEREEVHVVREAIDDRTAAGQIGGDEEVSVTLHEERPVVAKETVAKERIGLDKEVHTDTEAVSADVRKEQVEVVKDGDVVREDRNDRI